MRFVASLGLALATLILAGCGGGGGGADGGMTTSAAPTVAINSANQGAVTRATIDGGLALGASEPLAASAGAGARSVGAARGGFAAGALEGAVRRGLVAALLPQRSVGIESATVRAGAGASTDPCTISGSVTTTVTDADHSNSVSGGDFLSVAFDQCVESTGESTNGTLVFTVGSVSTASNSDVSFSGSVAFQEVSVTSGGRASTVDGSVAVTATITSTSFQMALTVGANALTVEILSPGYVDTIVYEHDMQLTILASEGVAEQTEVTLNGAFSAASIGGRIVVATVQPVRQLGGDAYPSSGQMTVTGAAGTRLRITALNATQVQLELDGNGDGAYEGSGVFTWTSL